MSKNQAITARPQLIILALGLALLCFAPLAFTVQFAPDKWGNPSSLMWRIFWCLITVCSAFGSVYFFTSYFRHRVVADAVGIRWRGIWTGWRSATWDDITDYYYTVQSDAATGRPGLFPVLVTPQGVITIPVDSSSESITAIVDLVPTVATKARVSKWALFGIRRVDDFPQTFRYWDSVQSRNAVIFLAVTISLYAAATIGSVYLIHHLSTFMDAEDLKPIYVALTASFFTSAMLPFLYIRRFVLRWQHRHESITVTPEEFTYENTRTGGVTAVSWSEITDYFYSCGAAFSGSRYTLVLSGADERQISWTPLLDVRHRLLAIVQEYAPPPANRTTEASVWRSKSAHEKTGGSDLSTWKSGAVGIGGRVFRYGTLSLGILLVVGAMLSVGAIVSCTIEWQKPVPQDKWLMLGMTLLFALPTIWGILCYLFSRVETDDMGITQFSVFGKKHLYWYAVADYSVNKPKNFAVSLNLTVRGQNGTRVVCWKEINGYDELKQEVAKYAVLRNLVDKTSGVVPG